jgi:hypothetical protein
MVFGNPPHYGLILTAAEKKGLKTQSRKNASHFFLREGDKEKLLR